MQSRININIAVNVIGALSDKSLNNNIIMMDNSFLHSTCQGTSYLSTSCIPGQEIQWLIYAVDVQTPVFIKNIIFIGADCHEHHKAEVDVTPAEGDLNSWIGIVPAYMQIGLQYRYRLELQMGTGENSIMSTDQPSLVRVYP